MKFTINKFVLVYIEIIIPLHIGLNRIIIQLILLVSFTVQYTAARNVHTVPIALIKSHFHQTMLL